MVFIRDGDLLLVVASNAGAARDPDWFANLTADPSVRVEIGAQSYHATAVVPRGSQRDELFDRICARYPFFADHQAGVQRTIPVVILDPGTAE
jgi:deazaflavin-dependent oxidoreductase (nitroreductase family)